MKNEIHSKDNYTNCQVTYILDKDNYSTCQVTFSLVEDFERNIHKNETEELRQRLESLERRERLLPYSLGFLISKIPTK